MADWRRPPECGNHWSNLARTHAGLRVIDGRFTSIEQAMGTPKGRPAAREFLQSFIEDMKRSGFVASALEKAANAPRA